MALLLTGGAPCTAIGLRTQCHFLQDLGPNAFNGTFPLSVTATYRNHLDTLHSDYAFIIAPTLVKSLRPPLPEEVATAPTSADFQIYPNPADDHLVVMTTSVGNKQIAIADLSGRTVLQMTSTSDQMTVIPIASLAQGAYWVSLQHGERRSVQKLIVH